MANWISTVLLVLQVLAALGVIVLVLLQHGKGADMGAAFGSGSSGSLFGATGSANFLSRTTAVLASIFFVCTLGLAFAATNKAPVKSGGGVMSDVPVQTAPAAQAPANAAPGAVTAPTTPAPQVPVPGKPNEIPK